jgi:hypothetical protein
MVRGLVLLFLLQISSLSGSDSTSELFDKCSPLGYNPATLSCDICEKLSHVIQDPTLTQECYDCCFIPSDANTFYELTILEVDKNILKRFEKLSEFLKLSSEEYSVIVRHKYMSLPTLLMYKERIDDEPSQVVGIESWSVEELKEYLDAHTKK